MYKTQSAQLASGKQLFQEKHARMKTVHHSFHEQHVRALAGGDHLGALGCVQSERFLAQDVFPRFGRAQRPWVVEVIGKGDVDDINVFIRE